MPLDSDYIVTMPPVKVVFRRWRGKYVWIVEARDASHFLPFPLGQAWVTDFPVLTTLEYILVGDQYRQRGIGAMLLAEVRARWPHVVISQAISDEGRALVKADRRRHLRRSGAK